MGSGSGYITCREGSLCQNGFCSAKSSKNIACRRPLWPWELQVVVSASGADCSSEIQDNLHPSNLQSRLVDLTLWHNQHVTLDALADLVRRSPDLFLIYIHASCSIDSHSLFWFLYEEMGPGVLRSHRALMRFLAVRIPKEDLLFPEAGLPEGIYQRIV